MMPPVCRRFRIVGRVQGVGYRAWLGHEARSLGLRGWVRNRSDGTVEAVLAGDAHALDRIAGSCGRGPSLARVTAVESVDEPGSLDCLPADVETRPKR